MARNDLDLIGIPEFFADKLGQLEDIGHGLVRVVRCIERCNSMVPIYSNIIPAEEVLRQSEVARDFCEFMLRKRAGARH